MAAAAAATFLPGYHFSSSPPSLLSSFFDAWPDAAADEVPMELEAPGELVAGSFELDITPKSLPGYHFSDSCG